MVDDARLLDRLLSIRLDHSANGFAAWAIRHRWLLLAVGLVTLPLLGWIGADLKMNRSLAAMFSSDDPALQEYQSLQSTFGGNHVVIVVYRDPEWKSAAGLVRNQRYTADIAQLDGVQGVLSVARLAEAFRYLRPGAGLSNGGGLNGGGAGPGSWLGLVGGSSGSTDSGSSRAPGSDAADAVPLFRRQDPLAQQFLTLFDGYTHDGDGETAAVVALLDPALTQSAVGGLKRFAADLPAEQAAVVVGEPVLLEDAFDLIETDGRRLAIGTLGLLSIVVLFALRDLRIVGLAALCILWSTAATRSAMVATGVELNLVSTILMAIVTVIVVAAVMHAGVRLRKRSGQDSTGQAMTVIAALTIPIAWTCLTDSAGFASLLVSDVRPVVQFGAMTATAAGAVLVSILWFAPALLSAPQTWPVRSAVDGGVRPRRSRAFNNVLRTAATISIARRVPVLLVCLGAFGISAVAVSRLSTKASFLENFRSDSPIVQAYDRVERQLGGAGVWDVILPMPRSIQVGDLDEVLELERRLRDLRVAVPDRYGGSSVGLTKVLSLADADAVARQATLLRFAGAEARLSGMRTALPVFADALLTYRPDEPRRLRIMLRSDEDMPAETKRKLVGLVETTVRQWAAERQAEPATATTFDDSYSVTGYYVLMSQLVDQLIRDQWRAMVAALASVGALLWLASGSVRLTAAALLVNTLPVLMVLAVVGGIGGQLDMGSAMIGAVSIGLSIDGSVHYLTAYQRQRRSGESAGVAAVEAASDLGAPILLATVALVVGFAVLMTSPFVPTATFGTLVAATLAASSLLNLTVLPAFVAWVDPGGDEAFH